MGYSLVRGRMCMWFFSLLLSGNKRQNPVVVGFFFFQKAFQHRRMHFKHRAEPAWLGDSAWGHGGLKALLIASLASSIQIGLLHLPASPTLGSSQREKLEEWGEAEFPKEPWAEWAEAQGVRDHVLCVTLLFTVYVTRSQWHPFSVLKEERSCLSVILKCLPKAHMTGLIFKFGKAFKIWSLMGGL